MWGCVCIWNCFFFIFPSTSHILISQLQYTIFCILLSICNRSAIKWLNLGCLKVLSITTMTLFPLISPTFAVSVWFTHWNLSRQCRLTGQQPNDDDSTDKVVKMLRRWTESPLTTSMHSQHLGFRSRSRCFENFFVPCFASQATQSFSYPPVGGCLSPIHPEREIADTTQGCKKHFLPSGPG